MDNYRNIWVLGGTGFIGKALINRLSQNSQYLLNLLVHKNIPYKFLEPFSLFTGNLETFDFTWMEKYPPDIVFHLARLGGSNFITRKLASIKGTKANRRLINFFTSLKKPPIIVYVSGSLMYGNQEMGSWADENSKLSPVAYARYYKLPEIPWIEAQAKNLLDIRFARPGWIIGTESWFKIFYWNYYRQKGKVPLFGDGRQLMSLVQVEDCAGQILNLAENGIKSQNLNIFSGPPVSQEVFANTLASMLNTTMEIIPVKKLKNKFGKIVAEALGSSIPLKTNFPELSNQYTIIYPEIRSMLQKVLSTLKNK